MHADIIPILTTSERRSFKKCPAQWWWGYRQGLQPADGSTGMALWFGIGIHECLAVYYQMGKKRDKSGAIDTWRKYCDSDDLSMAIRGEAGGEEKWLDARALGEAMLLGYFEQWGPDRNWDVIAIETPFELEIPDPRDPQKTIGIFTSTYDGVYRDTDDMRIKMMEHKTAKAIITSHLGMDDQGGSYWMSANFILRDRGVLGAKESIDAITYNFLRKAMPDDRPMNELGQYLNKDGTVSKQQPAPLFRRVAVERTIREQKKQIDRMANELLIMERFRNKDLRPFKNPSNDTCPSCPFREMCELEERGDEWIEYRDAMYVTKDPYLRYRKAA